ncbi:uncharacterized protein K452DRAFT_292629 [Aplosporella prunicola CBS 121167]|uniref:Uncharacterized protein n=1 Tax=Aplosporella prunicola CBS 121167 TaxID=1176127 RepID=A0A6A6AX47_9PEZI|nr:uncharacterized protein K452DRAFT_292629 [Aplosporella prunicola CBS 121167]KAF2136176.1 hypothetical protein K452DRAFT_292629 [Aplosporella prunicola CBS 121167]
MDEKSALLRPNLRKRATDNTREQRLGFGYGVAACLSIWLLYTIWWREGDTIGGLDYGSDFKWSQVTPTEHLNFQPCYGEFECSRLSVPLDWQNASDPRRAAIAITRLPAKVPITHSHYGGSVLLNPGGPGNSGSGFAGKHGKSIQTIIDAEDRNYDIIGFDPRGVNQTTPHASCFPDDFTRQNWIIQSQTHGTPHSNETFAALWARKQALAESCAERLTSGELDEVGRHMNTRVVVEDMIAIIERLGEWREKRGLELVMSLQPDQVSGALERTRWKKGEEKLLYWGFSYGTVLGSTFAAVHPERVERVVLDGVVQAEHYYGGNYLPGLIDADKVWTNFYQHCYAAGPDKCALYSSNGPKAIKKTYENITATLQRRPIPVKAHGRYSADVITAADLSSHMSKAIYFPLEHSMDIAQIIFEIGQGNGTLLAEYKQGSREVIYPTQDCKRDGPWSETCHDFALPLAEEEINDAIWCTDMEGVYGKSYEENLEYWQRLREQSYTIGDVFIESTLACSQWAIKPAWRLSEPIEGNTTHPILWIGNTNDPVTPLGSARQMATRFPGSSVLHLDSDGHTTIAAPSVCTAKHVRKYFRTGELPEDNELCTADRFPFESRAEAVARFADSPDAQLFEALMDFTEGF